MMQSSCKFTFKIMYAFENISIILMERTVLPPHALILHMLFSFDIACNFVVALKKALFNRTLITHTFNLTMARVN